MKIGVAIVMICLLVINTNGQSDVKESCVRDSDCPYDRLCKGSVCIERTDRSCETGSDCRSNERCEQGRCEPLGGLYICPLDALLVGLLIVTSYVQRTWTHI